MLETGMQKLRTLSFSRTGGQKNKKTGKNKTEGGRGVAKAKGPIFLETFRIGFYIFLREYF